MSYSFAMLVHVRSTWTFLPAQSAWVPLTVSVNVSQPRTELLSMQVESVFWLPPGLIVVPSQFAVWLPLALTLPLAGVGPVFGRAAPITAGLGWREVRAFR